jgi:DNA-binding NarL/FixJ family response regulator
VCLDYIRRRAITQPSSGKKPNILVIMGDDIGWYNPSREFEVMQLVITGMLNKQIAGEMGTAEKTVKVPIGAE